MDQDASSSRRSKTCGEYKKKKNSIKQNLTLVMKVQASGSKLEVEDKTNQLDKNKKMNLKNKT